MIGIQAIGAYLPKQRLDNIQQVAKFDVDEIFLREKIGVLQRAVKDESEETSDLCCMAFADLQHKTGLLAEQLDCIVVCTQNPDGYGLPHTSAIVHGKLNLPSNCAAFDISLGCSGFVYGLSIIQSFMQANNFHNGVLFTADPYSKIIDQTDKNTSLLFGDGATATLISDAAIWRTGKFVFGSQGKDHKAIQVDPLSRKLAMNGRAVFSFSVTVVPANITEMLSANHLSIADIDYFAIHQGSRYIVETLIKKLGVESSKAAFIAKDYGNTVSSSIPLLLNELDGAHKHIVIAGFGVGLSWASTVLTKID